MSNPTDTSRTPNSVHFTQREMVAAIAFYRDVLGFKLDECWPDDKHPAWGSLSLDRQTVMLGAPLNPKTMSEHCADAEVLKVFERQADDWKQNKPGVGVLTYLRVPDVDAYHKGIVGRGARPLTKPTSQFYGIRDFMIEDPSGHRLAFYTTITLQSCQSCGMPLTDAKPGQMYCGYCTDGSGKLKPYEQVLEGTIQGYFMGMKKMPRAEAEKAAKEHLATMPAWMLRK